MHTSESGPSLAALDGPALLDLLPVGVAQLADDGSVVGLNVALRRLLRLPDDFDPAEGVRRFGWTSSPADCALLLSDLIADADHAATEGLTGAAPSEEDSPGRLLRMGHRDGTEVWVRAVARRARMADRRVAYLLVVTDVTAEHRIGQELRKEREQFRILADHAGDVALVYRGGAIVWASPSVVDVLGRSPASLLGRTLLDLAGPDAPGDLPPLPQPGASATHRVQLRHADETFRWFQMKITARQTFGEGPTVYAWLRDIEDQVRAEQALAESERRLRSAFQASPDGWVILDVEPAADGGLPALRYALVNARTRDLAGLPDDQIIGHELGEIIPAEDQPWMREQVERALSTREIVTARAPFGIGDEARLYDSFVVALDEHSVLCSWRDVTDYVHAQELLHRAYEETAEMRVTLQTALDATSDGFAVYAIERDAEGDVAGLRVVHANAAGAESLGLAPETIVDMEIHEFFPEVESSGLWERILVAASTKEPQYHRVQVCDPDGGWQAAWDNSVAPVGEERMAITWRDVSKEEAAIRQLARTRDEAMYSATHDALTDLPNRVLLQQHLQEALRSCRPDERVGLVFVDLDRFKAINDTYGHAAGDVVLKATAARLNRMVRHGDLAARLAGDEFVLVLTALTPDWSPEQFFARASAQLSEPVQADGVELLPSASLGAVLADPRRETVDVAGLIKRADAAMYEAKAASRRR